LFGSLGMDLQGRHNSTAQAIEESKSLVWDTNMFKAALSRFPILERNKQGILERRIRELEQRFCEVATEEASAGRAGEIFLMQKQFGRKINGQRESKIRHEGVG